MTLFYKQAESGAAACFLCPHNCVINEGKTGICGVRKNEGGKLYAMGYGLISSIALDPIEKKPLYMFHPGKNILSIGGFGCNLRCPFCQNCEISMEYEKECLRRKYRIILINVLSDACLNILLVSFIIMMYNRDII